MNIKSCQVSSSQPCKYVKGVFSNTKARAEQNNNCDPIASKAVMGETAITWFIIIMAYYAQYCVQGKTSSCLMTFL